MKTTILLSALLTGLFCAGVSFVVSLIAGNFGMVHLLVISLALVTLGSLFAQTMLQRFAYEGR
jgi:uncharacterized YccA/Bax inhibitor family protein